MRAPLQHHYRSVPQNTVTEILQNLKRLPEDMRLMYLHLWCLGLRINEVCSIKREGYYLKEGVAWLRIYRGSFFSTHFRHEMVDWCNELGIKCKDHVFQTHDYRHSVATALYEHGASIQAIREFLGHKHENMTRRYIDYIQKHVDQSIEQYYKEQKSLVSEWKEGSEEDGN